MNKKKKEVLFNYNLIHLILTLELVPFVFWLVLRQDKWVFQPTFSKELSYNSLFVQSTQSHVECVAFHRAAWSAIKMKNDCIKPQFFFKKIFHFSRSTYRLRWNTFSENQGVAWRLFFLHRSSKVLMIGFLSICGGLTSGNRSCMIPLYNSMSPETNFGTLISIIPFNKSLTRKNWHWLRLLFDNAI